VAGKTKIVCLCEGKKGGSIDEIFINRLMKALKPAWIRKDDSKQGGSNFARIESCGGRNALLKKMPLELQHCLKQGGHTTLMVWADCDHDCTNGEALRITFWKEAELQGITKEQFDRVVFIFAKDRLENWIEFLKTGKTDETQEGPRVKYGREVADAARKLADSCIAGKPVADMPPSLQWSCKNWRVLVERMK